jgi:MATE family multidrug resistance protein
MDIGQVLMVAILRGFEDTEIPMWINLLAHWGVGLPAGFALARTDVIVPALGPVGLWFGLLIGLVLASGLLFWRVCWVLRRAENAAGLCSPSEKLGVQLTNAA